MPRRDTAEVEDELDGTTRYRVRAVDRTIALLEAVGGDAGRGKTLSEVARSAEMAEPTTLRYLASLVSRGYIERDGTGEQGRYRLGLGPFMLAERALGAWDIRAIVRPHMQELRDRYEETVNLAAFRQRRLVIIEVVEGLRSIRQGARVGEQDRLRSTALGKAMLAMHTDAEAIALLRAEGNAVLTPKAIVDDEQMLKELKAIRSRGFAVDDEESEIGLRCVGVALTGRQNQDFALSISGPSHLFTRDVAKQAGPVLARIASEIAAQLRPGSVGRSASRPRPPK